MSLTYCLFFGVGVILKMAYSVKDGSQGQKDISDSAKPPSKTLIIPAKDLVQVIAKVQKIYGLVNL